MTLVRAASRRLPSAFPWLVIAICCGIPLAWLFGELLTNADVWRAAMPDAFRVRLIARTFGLDGLAATLATGVAVPVALATARPRLRWLWLLLPVPLLMPSLVLTYGWKQLFAAHGSEPMPQSFADVTRCVIALASWLWPAPAMLVAFAVRRIDGNVLLQARLDGAVGRTVARLLAGPILLGWTLALLLAFQEFAVFEPTGISVIATEVRSVFETGASLDGAWTPMPSLAGRTSTTLVRNAAGVPVARVGPAAKHASGQGPRTAAALAVMLPVYALTAVLLVALAGVGRSLDDTAGDAAPDGGWRPPATLGVCAAIVAIACVALPIGAMLATMRARFDPLAIFREYEPQLVGSTSLALATASVATLVGVAASIRRPARPLVWLAVAGFLIGGQWAAIALIHAFNRPWLFWAYDSPAIAIVAYLCRFVWIALAAAAFTWSTNVRWLRDLAATDGADAWRTWLDVIAPTTWPLLAGGVLLVFTLSLTEVPATTLLQPADTLVPMLMTWAHILNYDAMIEASVLLAGIVLTLGAIAAGLVRSAMRRTQ